MAYVEERIRTFIAGEILLPNRLVKLNSTTRDSVIYSDATDKPIGVTRADAFAIGDQVAVRLLNGEGTIEMVASAAIACNAPVFGTADGKIDDADPGSGVKVGIALQAATANNDIIEVYPVEPAL